MSSPRNRHDRKGSIKQSQRQSYLFREISTLLMHIAMDDPEILGLQLIRVELSPDRSICYVFLYSPDGEEAFHKKCSRLVLYKPSIRAALSRLGHGRRTPNISFRFDPTVERSQRIEELLEKISREDTQKPEDN